MTFIEITLMVLMIIGIIIISLLVAGLLGLIPAFIAKKKGHKFIEWLIYGAVLFPFALLHSLYIKESTPKKPSILFTAIIGLILNASVAYTIFYSFNLEFQLYNMVMLVAICINFISYIFMWKNNHKSAIISLILLAINILILYGLFITGGVLLSFLLFAAILAIEIIEKNFNVLERLN